MAAMVSWVRMGPAPVVPNLRTDAPENPEWYLEAGMGA